jgi:hypothetical protein
MSGPTSRRGFLRTTAAGGALAGFGDLGFLKQLNPVSAAEAQPDPKIVRLNPEIEPLVKLLEETPRDKLLEKVGGKIRTGTTYREVLAALLLAGVRNIQPRPAVGFKFHAVLVVNSAHLASISSPDEYRWLPIFWALDHFKQSQAQDEKEGNWTMAPVNESAVPSPEKAREEFVAAMDQWDEARADAAIAGLVRTAGSNELFELFSRYGSRDFRDIGHKAIFVANSWRTLQCIGWQHAEPVLRSLTYALLKRDSGNPAQQDLPADRPGRENVSRAARIRDGWQQGKIDDKATADLLTTLRSGSPDDACNQVVDLLNAQVAPQSIFNSLFVAAGEWLYRQPGGIVPLHAMTSTNALHYAFQTSANDETRRMLLLQNAAFVVLFREAMKGRGGVKELKIDELEPAKLEGTGEEAVKEIFADVTKDRKQSAAKVLTYAREHAEPLDFINAARVLVFMKGRDSHDYKFSSAVLEDYLQVTPAWRDKVLAASMFYLRGSGEGDNPLVQRTRAALG